MLRFRNPGIDYNTQIYVIKFLYKNLNNQKYFKLEDIAITMTKEKYMTSYGYSGEEALKLSNTNKESMNSTRMNAKMYAEVFRMLGWVTPYSDKKQYPLVFTYIGKCMAQSDYNNEKLYEQCVLGINNPTELLENASYTERTRIFKCILNCFMDLNGLMYKHEFCIGPMSSNDVNDDEYNHMVSRIKGIRGNKKNLDKAMNELSEELKISKITIDNCTRLPVAFLHACNFVSDKNSKLLYGKSLKCMCITGHGKKTIDKLNKMKDLRLDEFLEFDKRVQLALIRLGIFYMLKNSGYDLSELERIEKKDRMICRDIIKGKELLFSPYQTIRRDLIEEALEVWGISNSEVNEKSIKSFVEIGSKRKKDNTINYWDLDIAHELDKRILEDYDYKFIDKVFKLKNQGFGSEKIRKRLFEEAITYTQTDFYPLIATLFKVMGFKCNFSRAGDNGARWDAIIIDERSSIPIEIKSPTEEMHLSVKAIRQALENKIVLLSRETYKTEVDVTTLAIGYYMPNNRSEVGSLIADIKNTYGYKIGVIDLLTLIEINVSILLDKKIFDKEKLYVLEGFVNANI
jgi:hypothetical protein